MSPQTNYRGEFSDCVIFHLKQAQKTIDEIIKQEIAKCYDKLVSLHRLQNEHDELGLGLYDVEEVRKGNRVLYKPKGLFAKIVSSYHDDPYVEGKDGIHACRIKNKGQIQSRIKRDRLEHDLELLKHIVHPLRHELTLLHKDSPEFCETKAQVINYNAEITKLEEQLKEQSRLPVEPLNRITDTLLSDLCNWGLKPTVSMLISPSGLACPWGLASIIYAACELPIANKPDALKKYVQRKLESFQAKL